jgi:hypothetical protein
MIRAFLRTAFLTGLTASALFSQAPAQTDTSTSDVNDPNPKRLFWIIPNFRTSPTLATYTALTPTDKYKLATQDSFDRGTIALALAFAGEAQLSNSNPSFGQGVKGYAHYAGTAYADFVIGNYLSEGVFPVLFHEDPRYFRRGTGTVPTRILYAARQLVWTRTDSGGHQFNISEVGGNAAAVAISMAYYPDNRNASDAISKLGTQIGVDLASNLLREFVPDLTRKFSHKKPATN